MFIFLYDGDDIRSYLGQPRTMKALKAELLAGCRAVSPNGARLEELCVEGSLVFKRLPFDAYGPLGPPLFALSESAETVPQALVEAVLEVLDPSSDSGNDWLEAKIGLTSEVRSAVDVFARRLARLSGHRLVPT